jgi:RNA polymerase sigma-70 factor (ECF subfamily)
MVGTIFAIADNRVMKVTETKAITTETLEALREGNQEAFEAVYLRYVSSIRGFLSALVRSDEVGYELTQDTFVLLWERRENIDPQGNIGGYLHVMARNTALKYFNKRNSSPISDLSLAENAESSISTDQELMLNETNIIIDMAVGNMPAKRREIYELSRKTGLTNQEIAERLHISKNTVENHVTSALKDIRKVVGLFAAVLMIQG